MVSARFLQHRVCCSLASQILTGKGARESLASETTSAAALTEGRKTRERSSLVEAAQQSRTSLPCLSRRPGLDHLAMSADVPVPGYKKRLGSNKIRRRHC